MAVTNRKLLQLAGGNLSAIQGLTGDNVIQPRELLVALDTHQLVLGGADGSQTIIGSCLIGDTAARTAATPQSGQFFFDTEAEKLFVGNGTAWKECFKEDHSALQVKDEDAVENNIAIFNADGDTVDSTMKFDDAGTTDKDVWSAQKTQKAINDAVNGMSWQAPVKSVVEALPGDPQKGDRYLVIKEGDANTNKIAEYDGSAWKYQAPVDGMAVFVEDNDHQMAFNGTQWNDISAGFTYSAGAGLDLTDNVIKAKVAADSGLEADITNGIAVKLAENKGLEKDANGVAVKIEANKGLDVDANGLKVVLEENKGLSAGEDGLAVVVKEKAGVTLDQNGLSANVDGSSIVINEGNGALEIGVIDCGTF